VPPRDCRATSARSSRSGAERVSRSRTSPGLA
jgi:hypothetical protein